MNEFICQWIYLRVFYYAIPLDQNLDARSLYATCKSLGKVYWKKFSESGKLGFGIDEGIHFKLKNILANYTKDETEDMRDPDKKTASTVSSYITLSALNWGIHTPCDR